MLKKKVYVSPTSYYFFQEMKKNEKNSKQLDLQAVLFFRWLTVF